MKAGKVMEILQISRPTLKRYRDHGYLKAAELPNGQFDYDADSVFLLKKQEQTTRNSYLWSCIHL